MLQNNHSSYFQKIAFSAGTYFALPAVTSILIFAVVGILINNGSSASYLIPNSEVLSPNVFYLILESWSPEWFLKRNKRECERFKETYDVSNTKMWKDLGW